MALADVNHDAQFDLAVTNNEDDSVSVFLGIGDGTFSTQSKYPMSDSPDAVVVADFDGDGNPDIATSSTRGEPAVALGRGDGTFQRARGLGWDFYQGGAVADFDRDGRIDLAFAATDVPEANVFLSWTGLRALRNALEELGYDG